jgi:hypothetical protein
MLHLSKSKKSLHNSFAKSEEGVMGVIDSLSFLYKKALDVRPCEIRDLTVQYVQVIHSLSF